MCTTWVPHRTSENRGKQKNTTQHKHEHTHTHACTHVYTGGAVQPDGWVAGRHVGRFVQHCTATAGQPVDTICMMMTPNNDRHSSTNAVYPPYMGGGHPIFQAQTDDPTMVAQKPPNATQSHVRLGCVGVFLGKSGRVVGLGLKCGMSASHIWWVRLIC